MISAQEIRLRRAPLWVLWILLFSSCDGCRERGPQSLLHCAPAATSAALWIPDLGLGLEQLEAFMQRAGRKLDPAVLGRFRQALTSQLGNDLLAKDGYIQAGIDPNQGMLLFFEPQQSEPLVALAIKNRGRFDEALAAQLQRSGMADSVHTTRRQGRTVSTAGRPFGNEIAPLLHWCHIGAYVLLVRADGLGALDQALARLLLPAPAPALTLADEPSFVASRARVPVGTIMVFAHGTTVAAAPIPPMIVSIGLGGEGVRVDAFVILANSGLPEALGQEPTLSLANRLDVDAVALLLSRAARPEAAVALRRHPGVGPLLDRLWQPLNDSLGASVEAEVLPYLSGSVAVGVYLANLSELPEKLKGGRRLQDLLDIGQLVVVAELSNPQGMMAFLERSRLAMSGRGIALRKRPDKVGKTQISIIEPAHDDAKLGWTVYDRYYVYAAGTGGLAKALQRLQVGTSALPALLQKGVGGPLAEQAGTVAVVRAGALADAATVMVQGADANRRLGLGALVGSAIELMRSLDDIAVSVGATSEGLQLRLRERLQ